MTPNPIATRPNGRAVAAYWDDNLDPLNQRPVPASELESSWDTGHQTFFSPEVECAVEWLGDLDGRRLLELGSGLGCGTVALAERGARVVGVDVSARRTAVARDIATQRYPHLEITFQEADGQALPFPRDSFDLVISRDVLMYSDRERILAECARVLRPGGRAVFVESLRDHPLLELWRRVGWADEHQAVVHHLTHAELIGGRELRLERDRVFYLASVIAFAALFVLRSAALYRLALRGLHPLDRWLLDAHPRLRRLAWRGVALYRKD